MPFTNILSPEQIKLWDEASMKSESVSSLELMERAAITVVEHMLQSPKIDLFDTDIKIFCGTGNNGGDGLAIARLLSEYDIFPTVHIVSSSTKSSPDFEANLKKLKTIKKIKVADYSSDIEITENNIVIDAIFGCGLNRNPEGIYKEAIEKINQSGAFIISVDTPSGFFCDLDTEIHTCIRAHETVTFQIPKLRMIFPESQAFCGDIFIKDIGLDEDFNYKQKSNYKFISRRALSEILKKRANFDHKGSYGHALLIAGSYGKMGAAVLSAKACMRSGAGLLTVAVPKIGYEIIQNAVPEAMAYVIEEYDKYISSFPRIETFKAIGIGPGVDKKPVTKNALRNLLLQKSLPALVIDADGINLLAEIMAEDHSFKIPENTILTPHVKEFERLTGSFKNAIERHKAQVIFSQSHKVYVVLKGANTCISTPSGECFFNSTGNPGMATAGSGDVLTGILTGLLTRGYSHLHACVLGTFLHGLAGDFAANGLSVEAMNAGDLINYLPQAFKNLYSYDIELEF